MSKDDHLGKGVRSCACAFTTYALAFFFAGNYAPAIGVFIMSMIASGWLFVALYDFYRYFTDDI